MQAKVEKLKIVDSISQPGDPEKKKVGKKNQDSLAGIDLLVVSRTVRPRNSRFLAR